MVRGTPPMRSLGRGPRRRAGAGIVLAAVIALLPGAALAEPTVLERVGAAVAAARDGWRSWVPAWRVVGEADERVHGRRWQRVTLEAHEPRGGARLARGVVWVYVPAGATRFALGLPGWRLPAIDYERTGELGAIAEREGIALVLAEMGASVYEDTIYPESRADRRWCGADCRMGGLGWIRYVVLPFAEARVGAAAGVFGLSTGGRGALSVAQFVRPGLRACAASGTFDLMGLAEGSGEYRIHANALGERAAYAARWAAHDNVSHAGVMAGAWVLLQHGMKDRTVPAAQSEVMLQALHGAGARVSLELDEVGGHDWAYWRGVMPRCVAMIAGETPVGLRPAP